MTIRRRPKGGTEWAAAAGAAVVLATVAVFALTVTSRPSELVSRLAAVEANAEEARQLFRRRVAASAPADAICRAEPGAAAAKLRSEIAAVVAGSGLAEPVVEVRSTPQGGGANRLSALAVRVETQGSYEAVLGLLAQLSNVRPIVFVDTVDLRSATSFVTLSVSGHAYCSASD